MPCGSYYEEKNAKRLTYVYGLYYSGECLYVGQTSKHKARFRKHQRGDDCGSGDIPPEKRNFTMNILERCLYPMAHETEAKWIQQLKPTYNRRESMPYDMRQEQNKIRERERYGMPVGLKSKGPPMVCDCGKKWDFTPDVGGHLERQHFASKQHVTFVKAQSAHLPASPTLPPTAPATPLQSQ